MDTLQSKLGQHQLRSWGDFLDASRFKLPEKPDQAYARAVTNLNYYAVNYLCIALVVLLLTMLIRPLVGIIVFVGIVAIVGIFSQKKSIPNENMFIIYICGAVAATLLISVLVGGLVVLTAIGLICLFVSCHAFLRCRSSKSKLAATMNGLAPEYSGNIMRDVAKEVSSTIKNPSEVEQLFHRPSMGAAVAKYKQTHAAMKEKYNIPV